MADTVNQFKNRLDKHWANYAFLYDYLVNYNGTAEACLLCRKIVRIQMWTQRLLPVSIVYSTVQYSTVQYSTVVYYTVHNSYTGCTSLIKVMALEKIQNENAGAAELGQLSVIYLTAYVFAFFTQSLTSHDSQDGHVPKFTSPASVKFGELLKKLLNILRCLYFDYEILQQYSIFMDGMLM